MSAAYHCDACGKLAEPTDIVSFENVDTWKNETDGEASWSRIDICRACWPRPFGEVLQAACIGFDKRAPRKKARS